MKKEARMKQGSTQRRRALAGVVALALAPVLAAPGAMAQDAYPSKPVRFIVPYGPGGVSDTVGRILASGLGKAMNATFVVENRGGAGGTLGGNITAQSAPDGYTIVLTSPPMTAIAPATIGSMPYKPATDLVGIGTAITTPNILVVNNDLPAKNIRELIAYGKGEGRGKLSYGSSGPGSTGHLSATVLLGAAGIEMQHVPYKTSAAAFPDVISGRVSMAFDSLPSTLGFVRAGKVRPILVMSERRSALLPDVPTAAESGFPNATLVFWMGIEGPARMPQPVIERLSAGLKAAMELPEVREQMANVGAEPYFTTPAEFKAIRDRDIERYGKLVRDLGLSSQ
ncbi:MAG TPA: tripartite tricarboxylate transporter substrate binding protein [Burkholderiales bacterium]|nr:tripartite tricarboxylate transporter substrate binding protein [Burkholderiales bacterium]